MLIRDVIVSVITQVCADKGRPVAGDTISDTDPLGEDGLGLDSLDMALVVAELDARLHYDPFAHDTPEFETVGQFVKLYEGRAAA
jgi:acyl carrier protein